VKIVCQYMGDVVSDAVETLSAVGDDISDPKLFSGEESQERLSRVKFCCVRSLSNIIHLIFGGGSEDPVSVQAQDAMVGTNFVILHKASLALVEACHAGNVTAFCAVRRAMYEWMSTMVATLPSHLLSAHIQVVADMLPHILEEKSSENMPAMWTALLQVLR
jgi:hypothetical protein